MTLRGRALLVLVLLPACGAAPPKLVLPKAHSLGAPSVRPRSVTGPSMAAISSASKSGAINLHSLNVAEAERVLIQHALSAADNNRTKAADLLGISVRTLRNKLNGPGRDSDASDE